MEEAREQINEFSPSFMGGHWIKGVEVVMGVVLLVRGLVWVVAKRPSACMASFIEESMVAMGVLLILIACMGLLGALLLKRALLWAHVWALIVFALLLLGFAAFTLEVTREPSGAFSSSSDVSDYPAWFQHRVHNAKRWRHIVACLTRSHVCSHYHPSPIQNGCCKPPISCNYTSMDQKQWSPPINQTTTSLECTSWSNDPSQLCYQCTACKVGVIQETRSKWKKARTILLIALITPLTLYTFCGCGLFKHERAQAY